jgi:hypothetical protein
VSTVAAPTTPFDGLPAWIAPALSAGGRIVGAALALYVAIDSTYDRTQVAATIFAIVALVSLLSLAREGLIADIAAAAAAGVLFFGGAMLWSETPARGMPPAAALALLGVVMGAAAARRSTSLPVLAFFAGIAVDVAVLVLVALAVEG